MALVFKFDDAQLATLVKALTDLSDNLAKWQGDQTAATRQGFSNLVSALGGTSEEQVQAIVDQIATSLNLDAAEIQAALQQLNQPKEN